MARLRQLSRRMCRCTRSRSFCIHVVRQAGKLQICLMDAVVGVERLLVASWGPGRLAL